MTRVLVAMLQDPRSGSVALPVQDWMHILNFLVKASPLMKGPKLAALYSETLQLLTQDLEIPVVSTLDDPRREAPLELALRPRHVYLVLLSMLFIKPRASEEEQAKLVNLVKLLTEHPLFAEHPAVRNNLGKALALLRNGNVDSAALAIRTLRTPQQPN